MGTVRIHLYLEDRARFYLLVPIGCPTIGARHSGTAGLVPERVWSERRERGCGRRCRRACALLKNKNFAVIRRGRDRLTFPDTPTTQGLSLWCFNIVGGEILTFPDTPTTHLVIPMALPYGVST